MQDCLLRGSKPTRPDLVIEVSDSSYRYESVEKASLYARADIPEYWVLDLNLRRLEVRQDPGPESDATFGYGYRLLRVLHEDQQVAPSFSRGISLLISEMLPPLQAG